MFENLEQRRLLAATIVNPGENGVLTVVGDNTDNTITLTFDANDIIVDIDGVQSTFNYQDFSDGEFHGILVNGLDGEDTLDVSALLAKSTINGGDGDDTIKGSADDDTINCGSGFDTNVGAVGTDVVNSDCEI